MQFRNLALEWIRGDPDPETRAELEALIASDDDDELEARVGSSLQFGTAGIRGRVGAGSARMNRAVVIKTTAGLVEYLRDKGRSGGPVVLGYDGRTSSRQFAEDAAGVLVAAGIEVRFFEGTAPTPLVSFAARRLGAAAAIVPIRDLARGRAIRRAMNLANQGYSVADGTGRRLSPRAGRLVPVHGPASGRRTRRPPNAPVPGPAIAGTY